MATVLDKSLSRLSRVQLIDLALHWLDNPSTCAPYLASNRTVAETDEEDYLFPPARSIRELRSIYKNLRLDEDVNSKSYVVDRIIDGDWRRGLSLYQHATIDFAHLSTHDRALRWTALRLVPLEHDVAASNEPPTKKRKRNHAQPMYPTISPATFAHTLRAQTSPLAKAHYQVTTLPPPYDLPILRLYLTPNKSFAPHQSNIPRSARAATDGGRTIYIALPHSSPHIYISVSGASTSAAKPNTPAQAKVNLDITNLKRIIIEAIPKALSRRHERWALESTKLTTRSLSSICALRGGNERPGTAGGAFSAFFAFEGVTGAANSKKETASETAQLESTPIDVLGRNSIERPPRAETADSDQARNENEKAHPAAQNEHPLFFTSIQQHEHPTTSAASSHLQHNLEATISRRFGPRYLPSRAKLDRLTAKITDLLQPPLPATTGQDENMYLRRDAVDCAPVSISFGGADVVLGLRMLAELGLRREDGTAEPRQDSVVDLDRMPAWMTGEHARSLVVV